MKTVLDSNINIQTDTNVPSLEAKILEYENNHKDGMGKYFSLDEVNEILDKAIKVGRQVI